MLNKEVLESIFEKLLSQAKKFYDEFNAADRKIGDGDLGVTILNGLEEVNNNKANFKDDMGANFMVCSQAFVKKSGIQNSEFQIPVPPDFSRKGNPGIQEFRNPD